MSATHARRDGGCWGGEGVCSFKDIFSNALFQGHNKVNNIPATAAVWSVESMKASCQNSTWAPPSELIKITLFVCWQQAGDRNGPSAALRRFWKETHLAKQNFYWQFQYVQPLQWFSKLNKRKWTYEQHLHTLTLNKFSELEYIFWHFWLRPSWLLGHCLLSLGVWFKAAKHRTLVTVVVPTLLQSNS